MFQINAVIVTSFFWRNYLIWDSVLFSHGAFVVKLLHYSSEDEVNNLLKCKRKKGTHI